MRAFLENSLLYKKRIFKKKLMGFEKSFLSWVCMNPSNVWKGKLEVARFFCQLNPCMGSVIIWKEKSTPATQKSKIMCHKKNNKLNNS